MTGRMVGIKKNGLYGV